MERRTPDGNPTQPLAAWAPLRETTFTVLWSATVISNIGSWMASVGAGWLMTSLAPSPLMVALVQAATTAPVFLFSLPAGALADIVDRRRLLLAGQIGLCILAVILTALVWKSWITARTLLWFTFLIGTVSAFVAPAWQAVVPSLVPAAILKPAVALNGIGVNISRAIGPALAGMLIVIAGMASPFAVNAVSFLVVIAALVWWKPQPMLPSMLPAERLWGAMRDGLRYTCSSGPLKATMLRAFAFLFFANAFWALLPLISRQTLHGTATLYGVILAGVGIGAVGGGFLLPKWRAWLGSDLLTAAGTLLAAVTTALFALTDNVPVAIAASIGFGAGWIAVLSTLAVSAQTALPEWVRARGLAVYMMVMFGAMTLGSVVWGRIAEQFSIRTSLLAAVIGAMAMIALTWRARLGQGEALDLSLSRHWPAPPVSGDVPDDRGPVMTTVEYRIDPRDTEEFLAAAYGLRDLRRRNGAYAWGLFEDVATPGRFLEYFMDTSWLAHLYEHARVTEADRTIQQNVQRFQRESEPRVAHYLAPGRRAKPSR